VGRTAASHNPWWRSRSGASVDWLGHRDNHHLRNRAAYLSRPEVAPHSPLTRSALALGLCKSRGRSELSRLGI